jgi:excisionase family DNA binding protein
MLTTAQVAGRLGVSVRRVQALIASGRLKARKVGRDLFVSEADLRRYKPLPQGWRKGKKRKSHACSR